MLPLHWQMRVAPSVELMVPEGRCVEFTRTLLGVVVVSVVRKYCLTVAYLDC